MAVARGIEPLRPFGSIVFETIAVAVLLLELPMWWRRRESNSHILRAKQTCSRYHHAPNLVPDEVIRTLTEMVINHLPLPFGLRGGGTGAARGSRTLTVSLLRRLSLPDWIIAAKWCRRRESNPYWIAPRAIASAKLGYDGKWSGRRESNPRNSLPKRV